MDDKIDMFDTEYQTNLFIIEDALRVVNDFNQGSRYPDIYDAKLLELIDSVTLEE